MLINEFVIMFIVQKERELTERKRKDISKKHIYSYIIQRKIDSLNSIDSE